VVAVGIDVSKGKSMVAAICANEVVAIPQEFAHTTVGLAEMVQLIKSFNRDVKITMEATGHYHEPVAHVLCNAGFFVSVVNPLLIYAYGNNSVRRVKTDRKDALKIAAYCYENKNNLVRYTPQENTRRLLKMLSRQYFLCLKTVHTLENNLVTILDKTFPGVCKLFSSLKKKNGRQKWVDFALDFYHAEVVVSLDRKQFAEKYNEWCMQKQYRFAQEKADEIYALANAVFPVMNMDDETKFLVMIAAKQVIAVAETLAGIKAELVRKVLPLPEYSTVSAMYGVGDLTCAHLIAEIGDINRFHSGKALVAFAGIDPLPVQSGTYDKKSRATSKRGSGILRKVLFQVMLTHLRRRPAQEDVYAFLDKKRTEGKPYFVYMTAAANKFLRRYYAKVRDAPLISL